MTNENFGEPFNGQNNNAQQPQTNGGQGQSYPTQPYPQTNGHQPPQPSQPAYNTQPMRPVQPQQTSQPTQQMPQVPQNAPYGNPQQSQQTRQYGYGQPQQPTQTYAAQQGSAQTQHINAQIGQPTSGVNPGGPQYAQQNNQTPRTAAQANPANAFADPANAHGTQASVTANGISVNAQTMDQILKKNRTTTIWTAVGAAAAAALLVAGLGMAGIHSGLITVPSNTSLTSISSSTGGTGTSSTSGSKVDWTTVAKKVSASVVSIQGTVSGGTVIGSGAILDKDGDIITNNHVVSGASDLQVTLSNGNMYEAEVVGTDATTDLAVVKIKDAPSNLTPVTFADSDDLAVGEAVMAIGSPLGYENTATTGVVSALNRPVSVSSEDNSSDVVVTNAVQIDASINSGNSGGPTFNTDGKLIGINSSIATTGSSSSSEGSAGSIGIGFAIPANLAKWVTTAIIKDGKATHVSLGVTVKSATAEADGVTRSGSQVQSVTSGSAAASAGVEKGDTIVAYNKHSVGSNAALLGYVRATQKGAKVTLTVIRDGKTLDLTVTMNHEESTTSSSSSNSQRNNNNGDSGNSDNGNSDDGSDSSNPFEQFFGNNGNN